MAIEARVCDGTPTEGTQACYSKRATAATAIAFTLVTNPSHTTQGRPLAAMHGSLLGAPYRHAPVVTEADLVVAGIDAMVSFHEEPHLTSSSEQ